MLEIKRDINQQDFNIVNPKFVNFHSFLAVDRVSETQLQVGENFNLIIWRLKCEVIFCRILHSMFK